MSLSSEMWRAGQMCGRRRAPSQPYVAYNSDLITRKWIVSGQKIWCFAQNAGLYLPSTKLTLLIGLHRPSRHCIWVYHPCYVLLSHQYFLLKQTKLIFLLSRLTWISHRNLESYHFHEVEHSHWAQVQTLYTGSKVKKLKDWLAVMSHRSRSGMFLFL